MARIEYKKGNSEKYEEVKKQIVEQRGYFPNLYKMLLHSESITLGWLNLMTAIRQKNSLNPLLREMIILRVAVLNNANYEFESHLPIALKLGLSKDDISLIKSDCPIYLDNETHVVMHYTDEMTKNIQFNSAVVSNLKKYYNDKEILEITVTVASYNMVSRVLEALAIDHD